MSAAHTYTATVRWTRKNAEAFSDRRYSRAHVWSFDGGVEVEASASPLIVRAPYSAANAVDPEEAFVASASSCHMLFFLDYAARAKFVVDSYEDTATGTMGKTPDGRDYIATIVLEPRISYSGPLPSADEVAALHEAAHRDCFIANSMKTEITVRAPNGGE